MRTTVAGTAMGVVVGGFYSRETGRAAAAATSRKKSRSTTEINTHGARIENDRIAALREMYYEWNNCRKLTLV